MPQQASERAVRGAEPAALPVAVEIGRRRVFASVLGWPGWCRSGRDEAAAIAALEEVGFTYAAALSAVGVPPPPGSRFAVVERLGGSATTDFGAPGAIAATDAAPCSPSAARHLLACVEATWAALDSAAAAAPAVLRKGPRGGGRDRDAIVRHVVEAEAAYARKMGLRLSAPPPGDPEALTAHRAALAAALLAAAEGPPQAAAGWPPRYAARRIGWHALDHAWEIEARATPAAGG